MKLILLGFLACICFATTAKIPKFCEDAVSQWTEGYDNDLDMPVFVDQEGFKHYFYKLHGQEVAHVTTLGDPFSSEGVYYVAGSLANWRAWRTIMGQHAAMRYNVAIDSKGFGCSSFHMPPLEVNPDGHDPTNIPKELRYDYGYIAEEWHAKISEKFIGEKPHFVVSGNIGTGTVFGYVHEKAVSGNKNSQNQDHVLGWLRSSFATGVHSSLAAGLSTMAFHEDVLRGSAYKTPSQFAAGLMMGGYTSGATSPNPFNPFDVAMFNMNKEYPIAPWVAGFQDYLQKWLKEVQRPGLVDIKNAQIPVLNLHGIGDYQLPVKIFDGSLSMGGVDGYSLVYTPDTGVPEWEMFHNGVSEWNPLMGHFGQITHPTEYSQIMTNFFDAVTGHGSSWNTVYTPLNSFCVYDDHVFTVGTTFCTYTGRECTCNGNIDLTCVPNSCTPIPVMTIPLNPNPFGTTLPPLLVEIKFAGKAIPKPFSYYIEDWGKMNGIIREIAIAQFSMFDFGPYTYTMGMSDVDFTEMIMEEGIHGREFDNAPR